MEKRTFLEGEILFAEGQQGTRAFIIKKGSVTVTRATKGGWEKHVATIKEGNIVGEMSLIDDSPHSVTATARQDGEAMVLTRDEYKKRLENSDKVLALLLRTFADKLRATYE